MNRLTAILRKNLNLVYVSAAAFFIGIPFGALAYPFFEGKMPRILEEAFGGIMTGSTAEIILKVFVRNMQASAFMMFLGATIVLAIGSLFLNGFLVGLVFRFALGKGLNASHLLLGILPHGVFELPAVFISTALGIRVGLQLITEKGRRLKAAAEAIKEASAVYILTVVPLLIVAAAMEILVSKNLIQ
jgi:stage II sporulation protein M